MMRGTSERLDDCLRGGSWNNDAGNLAAAYRNRNWSWNRNTNIGFRCVLAVAAEHASHGEHGEPCRRLSRAIRSGGWDAQNALPGRSSKRRASARAHRPAGLPPD